MKKPIVAVLMSTYNGSAYLEEQLKSIAMQKDVEVHLYVRDDGSVDSTLTILEEYSKKNYAVVWKGKQNVGPGRSFMKMLYKIGKKRYDFYAFADQDDIWFQDKLITAIKKIEEIDKNCSVLYTSNQYKYCGNRNMGERFCEDMTPELIREVTSNQLYGCTFVMNKKLVECIINEEMPPDDIICNRGHDTWCVLTALVTGVVLYDSNAHIYYRLHDKNAVGLCELSIFDRIKRFFSKGKNNTDRRNMRSKTAKAILERFDVCNVRDKEVLEEYAYYRDSWKQKRKLLRDKEAMKAIDSKQVGQVLRVLLNIV